MKLITQLAALVPFVQVVSCQEVKEQNYEIQLSVVDDSGKPVQGAAAVTGSLRLGDPILNSKYEKVGPIDTDAAGVATLKFRSLPPINGGPSAMAIVTKPGYYETKTADLPWQSNGSGSWKSQIKAVLKPVNNPIPMHADSMIGEVHRYVRIPKLNKEYGYDLMLCQPLPPLGNGKTADFMFHVEGAYRAIDQYHLTLKVSFPNEGEGIIEFLTPQRWSMHEPFFSGSLLQSGHEAPEDAYLATLSRTTAQEPGIARKIEIDQKRNFYFKCRTKIGPDGKVVSVNYGKIYGDFEFSGGNKEKGFIASFGWSCTYFNPIENDRNVEFDPKRNLNPESNVHWP